MFTVDEYSGFRNLRLVQSDSGTAWGYSQIYETISRLSDALQTPSKKLIALICDNSVLSILAYFACVNSGNAVLLINANTDGDLINNLIKTYSPDFILPFGDAFRPTDSFSQYFEYSGIGVFKSTSPPETPINNDTAVLLTTSGTTGSPKLVRLSYTNIKANTDSIIKYLKISDNDCAITNLPMSYSYGLSVVNTYAATGACIVATNDTIVQAPFWKQFKSNNVTALQGVPYSYHQLEQLRFARMNLPSLQLMTQAGGKLAKDKVELFNSISKEKGFRFVVMYGQTEATARISYLPYERIDEKLGSCGIAIPGGALSVRSAEGSELPPNCSGEVIYRGANVMMGYAECREDLSAPDVMNGVLPTGDYGYMDEDGFLYITGRLKRFIKLLGQRINLDEVERMVEKEAGLLCAASPSDEELRIAVGRATESDISSIATFLASTLGLHHSLLRVLPIDRIPTLESGKKDYKKIKELMQW